MSDLNHLISRLPRPINISVKDNNYYFVPQLKDTQLSLDFYDDYHNTNFWALTSRQRNFVFFKLAQYNQLAHIAQRGELITIDGQNIGKQLRERTQLSPHDQLMQSVNAQYQNMISTLKGLHWQVETSNRITYLHSQSSYLEAEINRKVAPYLIQIHQTNNHLDQNDLNGLTQITKNLAKINKKLSKGVRN